ncbi:MAG TPA: MarR family transcriptional regulator [Candidatus Dormibacteraeota bacterium]|nr:MarR family transcriptional regulator [Candidatus Dormibacteraeota bacterium]
MPVDPADDGEVRAVLRALLDAVALVEAPRLRLRHAQGLTLPQFAALRHLRQAPHTQSELVELIGLSPAGVSRAVDRLQDDGLVVAERRESNRRIVDVRITDAGLRALEDVSPLRDTVIEQAIRNLPSERRVGIARALRELVAAVGAGQLPHD